MATTYLQLSNELLRESNEVVLTSANFSSAVGIQQHVKDCVNRAYHDIVSAEPRWSFLATGESGATDPFYGNVYVETVAGTRWYELKAASSAVTTDYSAVNWDDFYLTTINVSGESAPFVSRSLHYLGLTDWRRHLRDSENADDADTQAYGEPRYVLRSPDHRKFGLSPIPDKVYNVHFYAYSTPTALSSHSDAMVLPDQYGPVITAKTRYYVHQFKEQLQQAAFAMDDYKKGMRHMKNNLVNPDPVRMTDDRTYF